MEAVISRIRASRKYQDISEDAIDRIVRESFERHKRAKEAEKAARERLHGITGAFMTPEALKTAERCLRDWTFGEDERLAEALSCHASTRERLPLQDMDAFFGRLKLPKAGEGRVLDLACGLNPVYLASRGADVLGVDLHAGAVRLINEMGVSHGLPVSAIAADLLSDKPFPEGEYAVALLLKLLPVLEAQRAGSAQALLARVPAQRVVVSFPMRTLSGRNVGMREHYMGWMEAHTPEGLRQSERFEHGGELTYIFDRDYSVED